MSVKGQVILSGTPGIDLDWEECYWAARTHWTKSFTLHVAMEPTREMVPWVEQASRTLKRQVPC